ncbi:MAG: glycosyltransferase family 2 protein [Gemmatimonadaceae bacterium]|nr:glycosyltransferase family 2 protein [Gemmatimonadaceae bacterium]
MTMDFSLIFPCYNEEGHLEQNVDRVVGLLSLLDLDYEIVLVDDFSRDGTRDVIRTLEARYPGTVRAKFHPSNEGRGGAFMTGFSASTGKYVGFFDVDFEIGPSYLVECLASLRQGAELVIGKRIYALQFTQLHRQILSRLYARAVSVMLRLPSGLDTESGYKFFRRESLKQYEGKFEHSGWFWDTEVVSRFVWDRRKIVAIPVAFVRNHHSPSTVRILRDSVEYFRNLVQFRRHHVKQIIGYRLPFGTIASCLAHDSIGEMAQAALVLMSMAPA